MNRKKLPKAIRRAPDALRQEVPATHASDLILPADGDAVPSFAARQGDLVASAPARPVAPQRWTPEDVNAVRRLARANAIVERHATYSAAGGLIPLPVLNVASVTAIILRMVKSLSRLYGVPFERDRARAIVVGLAGGATATGLAAVATSTLQFLMPASAVIGLAVSSVTAVACTRSIGRVFVAHFENGETLHDFPVIEGR
jgi:uncharacterized protein (DUF697 family)